MDGKSPTLSQHHPGLPVIYAKDSPVSARPVSGSLQKPYHPEEIVQAVRQLMRSRPRAGVDFSGCLYRCGS